MSVLIILPFSPVSSICFSAISNFCAVVMSPAIRLLSLFSSFWIILGCQAAFVTAISNPKKNAATMSSQLCWMKCVILDIWFASSGYLFA